MFERNTNEIIKPLGEEILYQAQRLPSGHPELKLPSTAFARRPAWAMC